MITRVRNSQMIMTRSKNQFNFGKSERNLRHEVDEIVGERITMEFPSVIPSAKGKLSLACQRLFLAGGFVPEEGELVGGVLHLLVNGDAGAVARLRFVMEKDGAVAGI